MLAYGNAHPKIGQIHRPTAFRHNNDDQWPTPGKSPRRTCRGSYPRQREVDEMNRGDLLAEVVVNSVTDLVVMGVVDFFCEQDDRNRGRASHRPGVEAAPPASQPAF